jgi:class 3 adenylate cyclase
MRGGYAEMLGDHQRLLRAAFDEHGGREVHTEGDAFFVAFARASDAIAAALSEQVLISSSTRELVADELPADVALRDLGQHRLKDLDRPEHLFQLVIGDLPTDFPAVLQSLRHVQRRERLRADLADSIVARVCAFA